MALFPMTYSKLRKISKDATTGRKQKQRLETHLLDLYIAAVGAECR